VSFFILLAAIIVVEAVEQELTGPQTISQPRWPPGIGGAFFVPSRLGFPWLSYSCPACQQVGSVDLRTLDRHPGAAISSLIPSVSCRRCSPNAPFARL